MPSGGPMIDLKVDGKTRPAIVSINKTSWFFEFDRQTGKPIFDVEERPVPKGDVPRRVLQPDPAHPDQAGTAEPRVDDQGRHGYGGGHHPRARRGVPGDVGQGRRLL